MRIEAHQLGKRYGDHTLFKNLSFAVESGECLAITGANGSGKSTLIQLLYSYVAPTFGSITYSINGFPLPLMRLPRVPRLHRLTSICLS